MSYADYQFYTNTYGGSALTAQNAAVAFERASASVDALTYCRIARRGFEALTDFQKGIVQRVVCGLAEWQEENADMLNSPYQSYSINGVSANWGSSQNIKKVGDTLIPSRLYAELVKTGLCFRGV